MSYCLLVSIILTLHLVGGEVLSIETESSTIDTKDIASWSSQSTLKTTTLQPTYGAANTARHGEPQDQQGQCAWWCQELYGIIALCATGTILLISIVLVIISCCLWRRTQHAKKDDVNGRELDLLGPQVPQGSSTVSPVQEGRAASVVMGVSDVENCTSDSELPKPETLQDVDHQIAEEDVANFPPPEDIPMLP